MKKNSATWMGFIVMEIMFCTSCRQKSPDIEWQKALGGSLYDGARGILQTADGGYFAIGSVNSMNGDIVGNHGAKDFWIFSLSKQGTVFRKQCFGGDYFDEPASCSLTHDGGLIVVGHTYSFTGDVHGNHGGSDIWVLRFDKRGMLEWKKALGGSGHEYAKCVLQNKDGTFLIGGFSDSNDGDVTSNYGNQDVWLVKIDSSANIIWQKNIGGMLTESISLIAPTIDGGYAFAASIATNEQDSAGNDLNTDFKVVKFDQDGNQQWQKKYGESKSKYPVALIQTSDGGFAVAGYAVSRNKNVVDKILQHDGWVMKLDAEANLQWEKFYGGLLSDKLCYISQASDGGYIAGGSSTSVDGDGKGNHGLADGWLIRLNRKGNLQWTKSLGGSDDEALFSLQSTADGGYIVCGESASNDGDVKGRLPKGNENEGDQDIWIVKLKEE